MSRRHDGAAGTLARDAAAPDTSALLEVAEEAARAAGRLLCECFGEPHAGLRSKTTPTDLVSDADHAAEDAILEILGARRPDDAVLGEESGGRSGSSGLRWIVDPLDGTVNFLFGIPHWAVSVACEDADGTLVGLVLDPLRDELFSARRGGPATVDGEPLRGSECEDLAQAMVATGFSYDAATRERQGEVAARLLPRVRDLRRLGSAALDLAWTAAGRCDAFYERGLQAWDRAAGQFVCQEAGLAVCELPTTTSLPDGVLVSPAPLTAALRALVSGSGGLLTGDVRPPSRRTRST